MPPPATPQLRASRPPAPGAVRAALPVAQLPQLATLGTTPPAGAGWLAEIKFDGYRLLAAIDHGQARLLTRSGLDWSERLPAMRGAIARLGLHTAVLDGELVALDGSGVSSFPRLQAALKAGQDASLTFYAFDLLHLDGSSIARLSYSGHSRAGKAWCATAPTTRARRPSCIRTPAAWASRHRVQARGSPLPAGPERRLAEAEVRRPGGVRRRRLHADQRQPGRDRRAAARLLRPRRPPRRFLS